MSSTFSSAKHPVWFSLLLAILGGGVAGAIAKFADESTIPAVGIMTTNFGVWVVLATLIATWSQTAGRAVLYCTAFMLTMVATYYVVQQYLFGFFAFGLFWGWAFAALLLAGPFAILVWRARQTGWWAAFGAALPIGISLQEAYSVRFRLNINVDYSLLFAFDLVCALLFLFLLSQDWMQRSKVIAWTAVIFIIANFSFNYLLPLILGNLG